MKIGILSDTHDKVERARRAVESLEERGAEALFHCGDITTPDVVYEFHSLPTHFVFGNCDDDRNWLQKAMQEVGGICLGRGGLITLADRRIAITHGDSQNESLRLESMAPDYFLSGHTHIVSDLRDGGIRRINPGALHRAATWTVALLDLRTDSLEFLTIDGSDLKAH